MESNRVTEKISKVFVIAFIIGALGMIIYGYRIKFDIEINGKASIGKYVSRNSWGKGEVNNLIYYVDGIKHEGNGGRVSKGFENNIGKFYRIQYSTKYENHIKAFFDQEVIDTLEILKAGFSKSEIE
ncbi:hypothetical protein [Flavobacterium sp.]|uniref:hypothetical protein n=1 Tax=Flavobacterium sp. TaxID=239 RepID=UPI00391CA870